MSKKNKNLRPLRDDSLLFEEVEHKYTKDAREYTSATTWIKSFSPPFWGFNAEVIAPKSAAKRGITTEEILAEWKATGDAASAKGTKVHAEIEEWIRNGTPVTEPLSLLAVGRLKSLKRNPIPEVRIYSEELGIAGTIDGVHEYREGGQAVDLIDWKTNGKPLTPYDFEAVEHYTKLKDDKITPYALQLSLYAYILEKEYGRKVKKLVIMHLTMEGIVAIHVPYLKKHIEQMIAEQKQ